MRTVRVCMVDLPGRRYIDRFSFPFCVCASICMIYSFSPGPCPYTDLLQKCDPRQIYPRHILYPVSHAKLKHIGISCPLPAFDSQILCRTAVSGRCAYFATNSSGTHLPKRCAEKNQTGRKFLSQAGLDGKDITTLHAIDINKAGIARTFQNIRLFKNMTVLDNVKTGLHNKHEYSFLAGIFHTPAYHKVEKQMNEQAMELLKVFELDQHADTLAANLPYGEQRKLEIARAMATEPKLLLLDEPAAGMNPNETQALMDMIRFVQSHFHMTILLIEHDMRLVSGICEELTVLNFGEVLAQGKTADVLHDPQVITAYLGE